MGLISAIDSKLLSLDELYFWQRLRTKSGSMQLFHQGWGEQKTIDVVDKLWSSSDAAADAAISWSSFKVHGTGAGLHYGSFQSERYAPWLPKESRTVKFLLVTPAGGTNDCALLIAPTSRETDLRRRIPMAVDLAAKGITSMLLDNPFMGDRKPDKQFETVISRFSDYPLLTAACVEENRTALKWMKAQGLTRLCATGVSQGGFTAAAAAVRMDFPITVVAVAAPHSAESVVIDGIPGRLCAWDALDRTCPSGGPARQHMQHIFDRTRLDRMRVPTNGTRMHLFAARRDRYVPAHSYQRLEKHWAAHGAVEWSAGGHVSTILERHRYQRVIEDSMKGFV